MKARPFLCAAAVILLLPDACRRTTSAPGTQHDSLNKIMPLGASRVAGNRPEYESFRYELWERLVTHGWDVDFIGTRSDGTEYPHETGTRFDGDHQGMRGWTSDQILDELGGWLEATGAPDIVLFSSPGGNDALEGMPFDDAVANVNAIIDLIQKANPNVTILIEQMAPGATDVMTGDLARFFDRMHQEVSMIASEQTDGSSRVIAVDMFTGFTDDLLADDVHYNEAGAAFIADRYYAVLEGVLETE